MANLNGRKILFIADIFFLHSACAGVGVQLSLPGTVFTTSTPRYVDPTKLPALPVKPPKRPFLNLPIMVRFKGIVALCDSLFWVAFGG